MNIVYFIQAGKAGPIKVGTTHSLVKRVRQLASGSPEHLVVLATIPGGHALELRLHRALHDHRHRLEWFKPTQEVRALAIVARERGVEAVLRWLDAKEAKVQIRNCDFVPSDSLAADVSYLISMAFRHAVARHGIDVVCETIERSHDRVEALMKRGSGLPIHCFLALAMLDPGACLPVFARVGDVPEWIARGAAENEIDALLRRIGPKAARG